MTIPHYAMPLRVVNGKFATVEDSSAADIGQSVGLLIATEPGERLTVPGYGVESSLFAPYVDVPAIQSQVNNWEPRAGKVNVEYDQDNESVKVTVSAEGGS